MPSSRSKLIQLLIDEARALEKADASRDYAQAIEEAWKLLSEAHHLISDEDPIELRAYLQKQRAWTAMSSYQVLSSLSDRQKEGLHAVQEALTFYTKDSDPEVCTSLLSLASEFTRRGKNYSACIAFAEAAADAATAIGGMTLITKTFEAARAHIRCSAFGGSVARARELLHHVSEQADRGLWIERYSYWNCVLGLEIECRNWEAAIDAARRGCWIIRRHSDEDFADALSALGGLYEQTGHHLRALRLFQRAISLGDKVWLEASKLISQDPIGVTTSRLSTLTTYQSRFFRGAATQCHIVGDHEKEFSFLRKGSARAAMEVLNAVHDAPGLRSCLIDKECAADVVTVEYSFTGEVPICRLAFGSQVKFVRLTCTSGELAAQLLMLSGSEFEGESGCFDVYSSWRKSRSIGHKRRWMRAIELLSDRIGSLLLEPLLNDIAQLGALKLALIPAGWLGALPLQVCRLSNGDWLADRYELIQAPSTEAIRLLSCVKPTEGKFVLVDGGGSDIPMTHSEIMSIDEKLRTGGGRAPRVLSGTIGLEEFFAVLRREDAAWLHLASHMSFSPYDPSGTHIALDRGGDQEGRRLSLPDILRSLHQYFKRGGTVVLSGCESGCFDHVVSQNGRETLSLASACVLSGARNVVAASWAVDDVPSCLLMVRFYQTLAGGNCCVSSCLRDAQRWLKSLPREDAVDQIRQITGLVNGDSLISPYEDDLPFSHPLYWAAWYCIGAPN